MSSTSQGLRRHSLGFWEIVGLAVGGMIGTWIVDMTYWFQLSGAGCFWALLLATVFVLPLGLCYSELNSMLPFSGGETIWATNAFGWFLGWIVGWALTLLYVLALTWVIYGIGTIAIYAFPDLSFSSIRLIGVILLLAWLAISMLKVEISGKAGMIMAFVMIVTAIIGFVFFFTSAEWHFDNLKPWFPQGWSGFGAALGVMLFKFVGFDLIPQFAEESNYPRRNQWKLYLAALLITFLIYGGAILANGGIWDWERIANATLIDPIIADQLGLHILAWLIIGTAILTVVTVIPGFWAAGARILYGMSRQRQLPPALSITNRFGQPWVANIVIGILAIYFAYFAPEAWVAYVYTIFSFTAGFVFLVIALSFLTLRVKHPEWDRPCKAPGGMICGVIAAIYCAWVIYVSLAEMTMEGITALAGFYVLGALLLIYLLYKRRLEPERYTVYVLTPKDISED